MCAAITDEAACVAAGCVYTRGGELVADADGCRYGGGSIGWCAEGSGGNQAPAAYYTAGPDPRVYVFPFDPALIPDSLGLTPCYCEDPDSPLACACLDYLPGNCGARIEAHCAGLVDEAACEQFQGPPGFHGCKWVESAVTTVQDAACSSEPAIGRCIGVYLAGQDEICPGTAPPASCDPEEAQLRPYFAQVDGESPLQTLELVRDLPCEFLPVGGFASCWYDPQFLAPCECPCL